jgi:hypothetical protein
MGDTILHKPNDLEMARWGKVLCTIFSQDYYHITDTNRGPDLISCPTRKQKGGSSKWISLASAFEIPFFTGAVSQRTCSLMLPASPSRCGVVGLAPLGYSRKFNINATTGN